MLKCPYCFEELKEDVNRCPHCQQFIIDDILNLNYPSVEKKPCIYCGKKVVKEAIFCKHCRQWLDEVQRAADDVDPDDLV